jgi:hypothetical protein
MFKRALAALVVPAWLAAAAPGLAAARAGGTSHKVSLSGLIDTISSKGTLGTPGATETDAGILAGTISGKPTGQAAFYQNAVWVSGLRLKATGATSDANGSVRFKEGHPARAPTPQNSA